MNPRRVRYLLSTTAVLFALLGCDSDPDGPGDDLPGPSAQALWSYLQAEDYDGRWTIWPGTTAMMQGTEPHGMRLTTYVNDTALRAIQNRSGTMPPGAMIVKENYMPDGTLAAVTPMYKIEGYNPTVGDWFFAKFDLPGPTIAAEGRVEGCQNCHAAVAANDYLFTGSIR